MDRERPEWEINLKSMFFSAAYRWKLILAAALVLALLLGAYQAAAVRLTRDSDSLYAQYNVEQIKYKHTKEALEKAIAELEKDIQDQEKYLEESVLMQLDYRNVHQARVDLYLSTPYQIMPGMVYQNTDNADKLLALYVLALDDRLLLEEIAGEVKSEVKYLKEVVSVNASLNHILSITVNWPDSAGAQMVINALTAHMQRYHDTLSKTVGEHTLTVAFNVVGSVVERSILERQTQEDQRLADCEVQLAEKKIELSGLSEPVIEQTTALKAGVKWAILGGVVGAVLMTALCCLMFIFSDKVYSGADLQARCGVRVLGSMPGDRKLDPITRIIRWAEGRRIDSSEEELLLLLQENLRQYAGEAVNILVTGDMKLELVQVCVARLQQGMTGIKLMACGSVLTDVDAVRSLSQCDAVLLLQKCGSSRYHSISREIARINDIKKPLVGCVAVEW